ncbi:OLC1v1034590C2 [Oldenlandia corymbosa var. corymbosa]|nr:OLC1v1034590C2 [Oldenlandia corymbosa var. corymbosa]
MASRNTRSRTTARPARTYEPELRTFEKGSTAIGHVYSELGVVIAVDHLRLSSDVFPENVLKLNSYLLAAISGGSDESRNFLLNDLPNKCHEFELEEGRKASAAEASEWLADFLSLHPDSDLGLSLGVLIAGWDAQLGPSLYKVDGKGNVEQKSLLGTGSGSLGRVVITERAGQLSISPAAAVDFAKRALCSGVYYCPEQSECVSVFHVGSAGVEAVLSNDDIEEFQKEGFRKIGREWKSPSSRIFYANHSIC